MSRLYVALLLAGLFAVPTTAQEATQMALPAEQLATPSEQLVPFDATYELNRTPEAIEALENFHAAKRAGLLPKLNKTVHATGDTVAFNVLTDVQTNSPSWVPLDFRLEAEHPTFNLWVSLDLLQDQTVTANDVSRLYEAMGERTPDTSIDPSQGVIVNNQSIFGQPPNYDGDGRTDILIFDIIDGVSNGTTVLGFVISTDINPNAPEGQGNQRDVLYLDGPVGVVAVGESSMASTAAHEHQHLIHFNYDLRESTFVNEGLSEWAQTVNGYPARSSNYLLSNTPLYNTNLFGWRRNSADVLIDYARASLFTTYFAQRVGAEIAGSLTRLPQTDFFGYQAIFDQNPNLGIGTRDLIADFHTANVVNDQSVNPVYGYEAVQRQREVRVNIDRVIDGSNSQKTPPSRITIQPGGVEYILWENVSNFRFRAEAQGASIVQEFLRGRLFLERTDGSKEVVDVQQLPDLVEYPGTFLQVVFIGAHVNPNGTPLPVEYEAEWAGSGRSAVNVSYDTGSTQNGTLFSVSGGDRAAQASVFVVPSGDHFISEVAIAPYFLSQFENTNVQQPTRDLLLTVWASDGQGRPGEVLFERFFQDPRPDPQALLAYSFAEFNIEEFARDYFPLPDTVFIGYQETGTDDNFMVVAPSPYSVENKSYIRTVASSTGNEVWVPLWEIQFEGSGENEFPVRDFVLPIRVTFVEDPSVVTDAEDDVAGVPTTIELFGNYPNPFNPSTRISYALPDASDVRLTVYDVTGRQVATLQNGPMSAGSHAAVVDASNWTSGVYFYTLEAGSQRLTKKMLLVK
ncbi:MAG: T9SS type A sorting domain-containing protein [Bacteroidota bacterium]